MIFILFLIHLLSRGVGAEQDYILGSRAPTDSCDNINNCRRLFDIVWGCATTIFAATWVSVHPNVPPPNQSWLALLWRRLKMMLVAVIAPEVMVGFAARQFVMARSLSNQFKISKTHGFFVCMGGFVTHGKHPIVDRDQLRIYASAIKEIQVGAIKDKSKGDALSKAVALLQGLWFITQCIACAMQHLPVTELEVATLAFAVVNIFIWLLWWGKPLDVQDPIILGTPEEEIAALRSYVPASRPSGDPITLAKFSVRFWSMLGDPSSKYHPFSSNSVPSFFSVSYGDNNYKEHARIPSVVASFVGAIFGAIHCAAWNAHFPSANEKWMWRSGALLVTAIPLIAVLEILVLSILEKRYFHFETKYFKVVFVAFVPLYIIARLFLLIIPFTSLRTLPPDTFVDVNWSVYIPHL
ncbi:hypothetical protein B0H14DRAFT_2691548 [Mycena olivaceomarginata]|nr:hypothetical protein B0H14DRAFT_2691548 [Mycena olivaceomarginata]